MAKPVITALEVSLAISVAADADPEKYVDKVKAVIYKCRSLVKDYPDGTTEVIPFKIRR